MGIQIEGGSNGYTAGVNDENRLLVHSIASSTEHHINHIDGESYNMVFSQSPTAADDCIAYILNSSIIDIVVEGITIGVTDCTANDTIYFKLGDSGTRNSASDVTPINLNAGSGNTAIGTFEKGADLDGGGATLAGGSEMKRLVLAGVTDLTSKYFNFEQDIIIPKNKAMTIWIGGSATGTYYMTVHFNYHTKKG